MEISLTWLINVTLIYPPYNTLSSELRYLLGNDKKYKNQKNNLREF